MFTHPAFFILQSEKEKIIKPHCILAPILQCRIDLLPSNFPSVIGRPRVELPVEQGRPPILPQVEGAGGVPLSPVGVRRSHPLLLNVRVGGEVPRQPVVTLLGNSRFGDVVTMSLVYRNTLQAVTFFGKGIV